MEGRAYVVIVPPQIKISPKVTCIIVFQITKCIKGLTGMLNKKTQELNEFKEKYDHKIRGQDEPSSHGDEDEEKKKPHTSNVLVVNPM
jgi:hypothetical protein